MMPTNQERSIADAANRGTMPYEVVVTMMVVQKMLKSRDETPKNAARQECFVADAPHKVDYQNVVSSIPTESLQEKPSCTPPTTQESLHR